MQRLPQLLQQIRKQMTKTVLNFRHKSIKLLLKSLRKHTKNTTQSISSFYISVYRELHNTQHVLIRLTEEQIKNLDNNYFIGAVLMYLSQGFDCIAHDLVIAGLAAYEQKYDLLHLLIPKKQKKMCLQTILKIFQKKSRINCRPYFI